MDLCNKLNLPMLLIHKEGVDSPTTKMRKAANVGNKRLDRNMSVEQSDGRGLDWIARNLGYSDINDLAASNGFSSAKQLAEAAGFDTINDFFHQPGYAQRMDQMRRQKYTER